MNQPLVVIIVLNWNGIAIEYNYRAILKTTLETLNKTNYSNYKVIVVDADSKDDSIKFIKSNFKDFSILNVANLGWAYANNRGIEYALEKYPDLDYVILLNDDLIFNESEWLYKLVLAAEKNKYIGVVGSKLLFPNGEIQHGHAYLSFFGTFENIKNKLKSSKSDYVRYVIGAVFLIKREVFEQIGLFDEIYLPFFVEETDFCERVFRNNYKVFYVGNTNITHLEGYSVLKTNLNKKIQKLTKRDMLYSSIRNNYIFLLRYYPYKLPINFIYSLFRVFFTYNPKFKLRSKSEIRENAFIPWIAIFNAFKLYRIKKIKFVKV